MLEAEAYLQTALATFTAIPARFEVARTHFALAILAHQQGKQRAAASHLTDAYRLFQTLQVSPYVERTIQWAR